MTQIRNDYQSYFKKHYKSTFLKKDLDIQKIWLSPQWNYINKMVPFNKGQSVFEMGCGLGYFYQFLHDAEITKYDGIDLDHAAVEFCKSIFPNANFFCSNVEDFLTTRPEFYDRILSFEVLEHVDDPFSVVEKIYSSLKVDGIFIGTSPYPYLKNVLADKTHQYVLHPMSWKLFFERAGFREVQTYPMSFIPYLWRKAPDFHKVLPFYVPLPYFVSTSLIIAKK